VLYSACGTALSGGLDVSPFVNFWHALTAMWLVVGGRKMDARMDSNIPPEHNHPAPEAARDSLRLLYEVGREFAVALDLRTVLHRVLFLSMKNVGAISGSLIVVDENGQPVESAFLIPGQQHDQTTLQLRVTYEQGMAGWVARHKQPVLVLDTSKDERWLRRPDDSVTQTGPKSAVSAPIQARDQLVGVITLVHPQPGFFSEAHLELVSAIAGQAGIAILNARLYAESQRQARVMTAIAESAAAINASLQLDEVLQRILEQISLALQVEGASLALIDIDDRMLEFRASTLTSVSAPPRLRIPLGEGIAGWVAEQGERVLVADTDADPRFSPKLDANLGIKRKSILCVPIRSEDQVIGVIEVDNPLVEAFSSDDLRLLSGIGDLAGTAIRHAQLYERQQIAHRRYRELFEDSVDPILITDSQGHILEANRQAAVKVGVDSEKLRSMTIADLHQIDLPQVGPGFSNLDSGKTLSYESLLRAESGEQIPIEVYVHTVYNQGVPNLQWILRDISERKDLDKMREDLIAMVYHDIRAPLSNVISCLGVIETAISIDDEELRTLFDIGMRSVERVQRLTDSLLDISRLDAGQPIVNCQLTAPNELLLDAFDIVLPQAQTKEIGISLEVVEDLPELDVDADMIRRVLINLLENAVKFTPIRGKIWAGAQQGEDGVLFWVRDSGPGIPEGDRERIFDKYIRLSSEGSRKGFGLGLAYCRIAVEGHGGRIWVESDAGKGARFEFLLPV
jgi:PAS domain S-box-containing protein